MRKLALAAAAISVASYASAGTLVFDEPVESEVVVADEAPMGSSFAGWIIPLVIVGVIVAVAANNGGGGSTPPPQQPN